MEVRAAEPADTAAVREIAHRSLEASYTLSPQTIEGAVKQWYNEETFRETLDDEAMVVLVAERDGDIVGFSEGQLVTEGGDGDLNWLHVDPDYRGEGIARTLFDATRERLMDMGASRMRGRVLQDNTGGNEFYEYFGFTKAADETVDIDGTNHIENVYVETEPGELEAISADGKEVYIDYDDSERASMAPFLRAYSDPDRERRYGYYCSNCESIDAAVDAMGRIECNNCGNISKATRWDGAYM
jgi:ribosomal protein S18 acetylase RimI-like enzyme